MVSLFWALFPFAIDSPLLFFRVSDVAVNNAPILLVALFMMLLTHSLLNEEDEISQNYHRMYKQFSFWMVFYLVLIPLQVVCCVWLAVGSERQINQQVSQSAQRLESLKESIRSSSSVAELQKVMAGDLTIPVLPDQLTLQLQKQSLISKVDSRLNKFKSALFDRRSKMLADVLPGVLRTFLGGMIVFGSLWAMRQQL